MDRIQDSGFRIQEEKNSAETTTEKKPSPESRILNPESREHGGRGGLDPARYGDWEIGGKCVDF